MIGIAAKEADKDIVAEFFELFKTPWEYYRQGKSYPVVVLNGTDIRDIDASLIVVFGTCPTAFDSELKKENQVQRDGVILQSGDIQYPIYGELMTFSPAPEQFIAVSHTGDAVGVKMTRNGIKILRIGYDLFDEVKLLMTKGQPSSYALSPTLDIHISNLRNRILESGLPLAEIPPIPYGQRFFVCLTHDVDFAGIRNHKLDYTLLGFIFRATVGSVIRFLKRSLSFNKLIKNLAAVLSLPLVYLGILKDFWIQFRQYSAIEKNLRSTFFLVPFKNTPGMGLVSDAPKIRSVKYDINTLKNEISFLLENGFEIGVHGIDSWADSNLGKKEYNKIEQITGSSDLGIRMHWLSFTHDSPGLIENAGYYYDSTFGYNEAVGFRAGTLQPFRLPGTRDLLELPLHIQDTALFYPDRMNLSESAAWELIQKLIDGATSFGGVLTFNWHQRSIAPERLWGEFYLEVLEELRNRYVKFLPAGAVVKWFKKRRSITFEKVQINNSGIKVKIEGNDPENPSEMFIRFYRPSRSSGNNGFQGQEQLEFVDYPLSKKSEFEFEY